MSSNVTLTLISTLNCLVLPPPYPKKQGDEEEEVCSLLPWGWGGVQGYIANLQFVSFAHYLPSVSIAVVQTAVLMKSLT